MNKFYKIVNPKGNNGLIYKEGYNEDPLPFNPSGDCLSGGIYFSREDIFAFIYYGTELYEVNPIGKIYENTYLPKKWKSHVVNLKYIGKINLKTIKYLIEQGANIRDYGKYVLVWAVENGHLNIIKYLLKQGINTCDYMDYMLKLAAKNGHLEIIKYFLKQNINTRDYMDYMLKLASKNGHLEVVKYLVKQDKNIHNNIDCILKIAIENGHLEVVKYLVKQGANIHKYKDSAFRWASYNGHPDIVKYIKSIKEKKWIN